MASVYKRGNQWIASFKGADGLWKALAAGTDKGEARRMANHWANEAKLRREGLVDLKADDYKAANNKGIGEHVSEFVADLKARGASVKHYSLTENRVRRVLDLVGAEKLADLTPSRVNAVLKRLRDGDEKSRGISKASIMHYTQAVKMLSAWLVRNGKMREDTLKSLKVGTVEKSERVHKRRALTAEETQALVSAVTNSGESFGMNGKDRAMLYRAAVGTGLRASELASLTTESFNLAEGFVSLKAAYSKRRRDDRQPLPSKLAEILKPWLEGKPARKPVFTMPESQHVAEMFKRDLRTAKAQWIRAVQNRGERRKRRESATLCYKDESGHVIDFHALRHTYVSWLVSSGTPVSVCQALARHSTPTLTLGVYAHVQLADTTKAVEALPVGLDDPASLPLALPALKTGTNDMQVTKDTHPSLSISAERALKTDGISGHRLALQITTKTGMDSCAAAAKKDGICGENAAFSRICMGGKGERPEPDSNRRQTDLQSAPLGHSGIRP